MTGVYGWIRLWGAGNGAERGLYADFLNEAAVILARPSLDAAAGQFRLSRVAWCELADEALPEQVPLLKQTRELLKLRYDLFIQQGEAALDEIVRINEALKANRAAAGENFPLNAAGAADLFERMREKVLKIHDIEVQAVEAMQRALE